MFSCGAETNAEHNHFRLRRGSRAPATEVELFRAEDRLQWSHKQH